MTLFSQRKPRGFHYKRKYADRHYRREATDTRPSADTSIYGDSYVHDKRHTGQTPSKVRQPLHISTETTSRRGFGISTGLAVILILLLAVIWKLLLS